MAQRVVLVVTRHLRPVNAAHILAPAQNLPDKALHGAQRCAAAAVGGLGGGHHLARVEHFGVERKRQHRMEQPPVARAHGVLVVAKVGQHMVGKSVELVQRFRPVQGPAKLRRLRLAKAFDACRFNGLPERAVVMQRAGVGRLGRRAFPGLAVVGVQIPLAADGLIQAVDQHPVAHPHVAVKIFHQPLFAAGKQGGSLVTLGVEMVAVGLQAADACASQFNGTKFLQLLAEPVFVR